MCVCVCVRERERVIEKQTKKQSNLKVMNLLQREVDNIKTFRS